jgi:hypothetical protein
LAEAKIISLLVMVIRGKFSSGTECFASGIRILPFDIKNISPDAEKFIKRNITSIEKMSMRAVNGRPGSDFLIFF